MKQRITLFIFCLMTFILCSYRPGAAHDGNTNATGSDGATLGCSGNGCHTNNVSTTLGTILEFDSAGIPVTGYYPGSSYTIKITATNSTGLTLPKFGFQMASVTAASAGTASTVQAGTWGATLPTGVRNTTTAQSGLSTPFIEQGTFLTPASGNGGAGTVYTETIPWTAPVAGTGTVKFFGVVNAVNATGNQSGDNSQQAAPLTIPEIISCPTVSLTAGATTLTAQPSGATSYTWYLNGNVIPSATSSTYTPVASGSYTVNVTSGSCTGTSAPVSFTVTGLNDLSLEQYIQVYPTVSSATVNIKTDLSLHTLTFRVYTLDGAICDNGILSAGITTLDISKMSPGFYLLTISDQDRKATYKIVKQ